MAQISLHFEPTADAFGDLQIRRPAIKQQTRNTAIGLTFIAALTLLIFGLYVADQAIFNSAPAQMPTYLNVPMDYD